MAKYKVGDILIWNSLPNENLIKITKITNLEYYYMYMDNWYKQRNCRKIEFNLHIDVMDIMADKLTPAKKLELL